MSGVLVPGRYLSARTLSAVYDVAEALPATDVRRILTDEGLPPRLPITLESIAVLSEGVKWWLTALNAFAVASAMNTLYASSRQMVQGVLGAVNWAEPGQTQAGLQIVEELLWEFERMCDIDPDLEEGPRLRLRRHLGRDGFSVDEHGRITIPPALLAGLTSAVHGALTDPAAITSLLERIQRSGTTDPMLAIGTAKELLEATSKAILIAVHQQVPPNASLPALASAAQDAVGQHPRSVPASLDAAPQIRRILGRLNALPNGLAELRNQYGSGHGRASVPTGIRERHARLAVDTACAWCRFMLDALTDLTTGHPQAAPSAAVVPAARPLPPAQALELPNTAGTAGPGGQGP